VGGRDRLMGVNTLGLVVKGVWRSRKKKGCFKPLYQLVQAKSLGMCKTDPSFETTGYSGARNDKLFVGRGAVSTFAAHPSTRSQIGGRIS